MAKRKTKIGALGPTPAWLKLSVPVRARVKTDIKLGLRLARKLYKGLTPDEGFDLRHVERWSAAKLKKARERIAQARTLTSRPYQLKTPTTRAQRKKLQTFTGQDLPYQTRFVVHVQDTKLDKVRIQRGQVTIVREYPSGAKGYQRVYRFRDYNNNQQPATFNGMKRITRKMLADMPATIRKKPVYYILQTVPHGNIGSAVTKSRVMDLLERYHNQYDADKRHTGFAEVVIGFYMTGSDAQTTREEKQRAQYRRFYAKNKKLVFTKPMKATKHASKKPIATVVRQPLGVRSKRKLSRRHK